ncbi:MAG: class I SAM-dependent methyltransferase [Acidimicrobiia bacterium]|nr:class I SAM-dependent methyltransferase [Acidimicrobiia bacterium]
MPPTDLSWFEEHPTTSIDLVHAVLGDQPASILDIGGGAGRLVDHLLEEGHEVTVLDISAAALEPARARLPASAPVDWIVADIRTWVPTRTWDVWHDRAMLHFLTARDDRVRYTATMRRAIGAGGGFVLGAFAEDGPTHCSGLPVHRFTAEDLRALVGDADVVADSCTTHVTPAGAEQRFRWLAGRLR